MNSKRWLVLEAAIFFVCACVVTSLASVQAPSSVTKPLNQAQVWALVRANLGDESGAQVVAQRGIDFEPTEDFLQSLSNAGAKQVFLQALRTASREAGTLQGVRKPLGEFTVLALVVARVPSKRVAMLVQDRGVTFEPTDDYLQLLKEAGAEGALLQVLSPAKQVGGAASPGDKRIHTIQIMALLVGGVPSKRLVKLVNERGMRFEVGADDLELLRAMGAEEGLLQALRAAKGETTSTIDVVQESRQTIYHRSEQGFRDALEIQPENSALHYVLGLVLTVQAKFEEAIDEFRTATRINPNFALAHMSLGVLLLKKGSLDEAIEELRTAVHLKPDEPVAHSGLGLALKKKGDLDGAVAEYREAIRLNPNNPVDHGGLGSVLDKNGDLEGAIDEYRAVTHIRPNDASGYITLCFALQRASDLDDAVATCREGIRLKPDSADAHDNLGSVLQDKGDLDGAIIEYRTAIRLKPDDARLHSSLGNVLAAREDLDGATSEYRTAIQLKPGDAWCHLALGVALARKGNQREALEELRTAYLLDPNDSAIRFIYESLVHKLNP